MQVIVLHDVDGPDVPGVQALCGQLEKVKATPVLAVASGGWWAASTLREWRLTSAPQAVGLIGIGSGGQAAYRTAYEFGREFPVVAAIAPACDLGRWYGRGTEIDSLYPNADAARQDEAPLFFNPLSRPQHQLCWCDPRDSACSPSALRIVTKSQSSGVPINADLETEVGDSRDQYLEFRAKELAEWVRDACDRAASAVELPIVSP